MRQISYDPLWKTLFERKMNKSELKEKAEISTATLARLGKKESVTLETILHICNALDVSIHDVVKAAEPIAEGR